ARPDSGSIKISGIDCIKSPRAAQQLIGVVPDESNLYPELSGFDNLCFCASLYGVDKQDREKRAHALLEEFGLEKAANRKFAGYSKGMKRKLTIAAGIIHQPQVLFLDEPTTGIDVASARQLRKLIADLNQNGTTIFLTTHYIEEAERLCDRIAFIVEGKIVLTESVENLLQPLKARHVVQLTCAQPAVGLPEGLAQAFPEFEFSVPLQNKIHVESARPVSLGPLIRFFEDRGIEVFEARKMVPTLEEIFVRVTGIEAGLMQREKEKQGGGAAA
ncbi:MAG: ABC transporter, partial [Candidatus Riflebacteria bacterium GWC2_50_8]